jgi:hypothetical protein
MDEFCFQRVASENFNTLRAKMTKQLRATIARLEEAFIVEKVK